jgi:cytochrome c oxidase cbb3-type subunit I/II
MNMAHDIDVWQQGWWHRRWERLPLRFSIWVAVAVIVASLFEIVPTFLIRNNIPTIATVTPYTPLELCGRDIYIREGCYNCHSQMIRPILAETKRYGEYSKPGEFVYDHPFQWGSRRIGPDLAREGGKQSPFWHTLHFQDPRQVVTGSMMPAYPWLLKNALAIDTIPSRLKAMRRLGVPYAMTDDEASADARKQAAEIAAQIKASNGPADLETREVVAVIAYLQRLGTDLFKTPAAPAAPGTPVVQAGAVPGK